MAKNASGSGSIRKKTVQRDGKTYTYWEARYTAGYHPGTGKQIQRSITGRTQREVSQKLKAATASIDAGTYIAPSKLTLGAWMDAWAENYLNAVKPRTIEIYENVIKSHIKPGLGAVRLEDLNAHMVQTFYNECRKKKGLSGKSIKNIHCVLHQGLQQAVAVGYIRTNPSDSCTLPRVEKKELKPFDDVEIGRFLQAIQGTRLEPLLAITLFTGLREGEVLGLKWDCVDFNRGTITVNKQLQYDRKSETYQLIAPKNGKGRIIVPAPFVMDLLRRQQQMQADDRAFVRSAWADSGFVFTNELGEHLRPWTLYRAFKRAATEIGRPDARFHDLRHSYAVAAIRSGDDIKTVQGNLGHATAAFTLDVYGHVTDQMKQASAQRMQQYINSIME